VHNSSAVRFRLFLLAVCGQLWACTPSIAPYSVTAYKYAIDLKVDSVKLMERAEEPYSTYRKNITSLKIKLEKAFEFAKGRPRNEYSARQWQILLDPSQHLLGGFLKRWERSGTQSAPFIQESIGIVSKAFDTIIGLESGKIKVGYRGEGK